MEWFRPKPNENAVLGVTWCWLNNSLHYFLGLEWTRWPLSFIGCFSGSINLYATIACYNSEKVAYVQCTLWIDSEWMLCTDCMPQWCGGCTCAVAHSLWTDSMGISVSCESGFGSSKSEKWNGNLVHSFQEVKSELKMPWYRDWEWKVKWKCLKIEVESEKWIAFQVLKIKVFQQPAISTQTVNGFVTLSFSHIACESLPFFSFVSGCYINAAFVCSHWLSQLLLPLIR